MTERAQRQPRPTNRNLEAIETRLARIEATQAKILRLLEAEPPRAPKVNADGARFYPGVGYICSVDP